MPSRFLALLALMAFLVLTVPAHPDDQIITIETVNLRLSNDETGKSSEYHFFVNGENYVLGHVFHDSPLAGPKSEKGIRSLSVTRAELVNVSRRKFDCTIFAEGRASNPLVKLNNDTPYLGLTVQGKPADLGDLLFHCHRT